MIRVVVSFDNCTNVLDSAWADLTPSAAEAKYTRIEDRLREEAVFSFLRLTPAREPV